MDQKNLQRLTIKYKLSLYKRLLKYYRRWKALNSSYWAFKTAACAGKIIRMTSETERAPDETTTIKQILKRRLMKQACEYILNEQNLFREIKLYHGWRELIEHEQKIRDIYGENVPAATKNISQYYYRKVDELLSSMRVLRNPRVRRELANKLNNACQGSLLVFAGARTQATKVTLLTVEEEADLYLSVSVLEATQDKCIHN